MKKGISNICLTLTVCLALVGSASAGQIVAWGSNRYEQCDVPAGDDFVAISAGRGYSLALKSDCSITAWGLNTYGSVDNVPEGNDFIAIAASSFPSHNLALKSNGSIVGWGANGSGQCDAPSGKNFVAIGVGDYHSLGLTSEGSIIAWGGNSYGVCNVPEGNDFIKIAAGPLHNLAIRSDGSLVGWGYRSYGECDVPAGNNFVEVDAGAFYSVALKSDGSLAAWGLDSDGCISNLPSGNDFVAISVGSYWYGLAIKADGSLVAWGNNRSGQCDVPDGNSFVAIAAGDQHCLAITTKTATLVEIEIVGPNDVREKHEAQYKALSHYDDGTTRNATYSALWWVEPETIATIDENGLLTTEDINEPHDITIYAEYTEGEITFGAQMTVQVSLPQTLYVPAEYETIQEAINATEDSDTVIVLDGTYTGSGNRDIDFKGKAITVRSENGPENCIIDCQALGRGFYFHTGEDANSILTGFTIINGYAIYPGGGGISCSHSSPTISNCIISGNLAISSAADGGDGGGIYCSGSLTISNCIISGNSAINEMRGGAGGGICYYGSPTITNCIITGNSAEFGGGIYCDCGRESKPTITNCTISSNTARGGGGAVYSRDSNPIIINCNITNNKVGYSGGGIYCGDCTPTVTNCIIWGNSVPEIQGSPVVTYSNIKGGWAGEGNIDADPHFAFPHDYHLMTDSPCIDAGTNTPTGGLPSTDIEGKPRPLDGNGDGTAVADMGAYEFNPNSLSIAVSATTFSFLPNWPQPHPQTLLIRNCGVGTLNWEIIEDCNWVEAAPANGISTDNINEVTLTVDTNSLAAGYYTCILQVRDSNAANSPVIVLVTMVVGEILRVQDDFFTIQAAIDAADDYDIVLVADGNYTGEGNQDIDFKGKAITVQSENGPENCIINCQDYDYAFLFQSGETAHSLLEGFTIINGDYTSGGIYCEQSSPVISNCILKSNAFSERNYQTGISCWQANPIITNCKISDYTCMIRPGGGGISCWHSSPTITNCTITGNSASQCGGIHCDFESSPTITNCIISGNSAKYEGGGISCWDSSPTITNCTISGNSARSGGGILCYRGSSPIITNCIISGNSADGEDASGGGIYCTRNSNPRMTNCTFEGNSASNGNALAFDSWNQNYPSDVQLTNCILADSCDEIWNNDGSTITITYSDVQGGWLGEGNIDEDPWFVEPGYWDTDGVWVEGDYHLLPGSPCIDAGDNNSVPADITDLDGNGNTTEQIPWDLDGNPRIVDGNDDGNAVVDMGAYETALSDPVELLDILAQDIIGLGLHQGIENSLLVKLDTALQKLEDDNQNNDVAAINSLQAFINAVEAQRGKKIPEEDADDLIAAALQIINLLSTG